VGSSTGPDPAADQAQLDPDAASERAIVGSRIGALAIGATSSDAIALILHHRQERPVSLFSLDGHPHLRLFVIEAPDLSAYASLKGASA
jgi:hypothetical protein